MAAKKEKSMEETFAELESIVAALETGDSSLEASFQMYEAGMKLVKSCTEKIDRVEKKILVLQEGAQHGEE